MLSFHSRHMTVTAVMSCEHKDIFVCLSYKYSVIPDVLNRPNEFALKVILLTYAGRDVVVTQLEPDRIMNPNPACKGLYNSISQEGACSIVGYSCLN